MEQTTQAYATRKAFFRQFGRKSRGAQMRKQFLKNKTAVIGLVLFSLIVLMAICAPLIADYNEVAIRRNVSNRLRAPSAEHLLGTDEMGRDVLARVVHGARISLVVGISAIGISLLFGGTLGAIAGFFGGWIDNVIMRAMDVFLCLPDVLLALAIVATFGTSQVNLMLSIGLAFTPRLSRVVRAAVMSVRGSEYVEAARSIGARNGRIILRHVLINCIGPIIVQVTLYVANAILTISALSFIGLGIQAPTPEWGNMLAHGREYMRDHSYIVMAPGLAIFFTILSLNLLGDGLRDTLDPRLKQ
ncbi:MAG: ABC transporter permease [Clostridia bacterium]|nr:ABC transporter permease [Clostridia bacterium]